jgi:hypothetical protein
VSDRDPAPSFRRQAADALFSHYELWLAERMPQDVRNTVFWQGEKIEYEQLREDLEGERRFFVAPSPYPGLRSFTPQEGRVFFGRRSDVDEVRGRLKAQRMVMVLGGSGSGKSSLVRAGVLPYLNGVGRIGGRGGTWYWCEFRPERAPFDNLLLALAVCVVTPLLRVIAERQSQDAAVADELRALGLRADADAEGVRAWLAAPFDAAVSDDERFEALWDFVETRLDRLDGLAGGGIRAGKPNLLILLDQFEEVFREAPTDQQEQQTAQLLTLLGCLEAKLRQPPWSEGGLFMALTMRSEELHRCGENDGLTNLVNRSIFLLELLDAERPEDRSVLHRAIVEPARRVFVSYGLYDREDFAGRLKHDDDAPFAPGVPDWLIDGSKEQWAGLEHRPDQLPLLQHAVRAMWDQAVTRWKRDGLSPEDFRIEREDLPGDDLSTPYPDLDCCLSFRADCAAKEARGRFQDPLADGAPALLSAEDCPAGEAALRAAFTALARQDDRNNRARRFATIEEMTAYLGDSDLIREYEPLQRRIERALSPLIFHGYVSGGGDRPYDISHEALLRNWDRCTGWLRENEEVVRALRRFLDDVNPDDFDALTEQSEIADGIPGTFRAQISRIGGNGRISERWARDQLELLLRASNDRRRRWIGAAGATSNVTEEEVAAVLARIQGIAARSLAARHALREERARADERDKQFQAVQKSEREAQEAKGKAERRFRLAAGMVVVAALALGMLGKVLDKSQLLFDIAGRQYQVSKIAHADQWPHATKLGVLGLVIPQPHRFIFNKTPQSSIDLRTSWDETARNLLGSSFWLTKANSTASVAAECWTNKGDRWYPNNAASGVGATGLPRRVGLDAGDLKLILANGTKIKLLDTEKSQLPPLEDAEVCVSADTSILSVSTDGYPAPSIYEVFLSECSSGCGIVLRILNPSFSYREVLGKDGKRRQASDGSIPLTPIPAPGFPRVTSIKQEFSGPASVAFYVENRTTGSPSAPAHNALGPATHQATFYRGWAAAQRINPPTDTGRICKHRRGEWICDQSSGGRLLRAIVMPPDLRPGAPPQLARMTIILKVSGAPPLNRITVLVPPNLKGMSVAKEGLILYDTGGGVSLVRIDEATLQRTVQALGDRNNVPGDVQVGLDELRKSRFPWIL